MIRINLLPVREAERALGRRRQLSLAILSAVVVLLMLALPYTFQARKLAQLDDQIESLRRELARLEQQTKEVKDLDAKKAELHAKLRVIEELRHRRSGPAQVLSDLADATPEKLWLTEFTEAGGAANIQGIAMDNQTIAEFMRRLQQSSYFFDVDLVETTQTSLQPAAASGPAGPNFKRFIVKARVDYLGRKGKTEPAPESEKQK